MSVGGLGERVGSGDVLDEIRDKAELCSTDCCEEDEEERMISSHYRFVS